MVPTPIILILLVLFLLFFVYQAVIAYGKAIEPTEEEEQKEADEAKWWEGYAFDLPKVPASKYINLMGVTPKEQAPGYIDLKSFSAVLFTQDHGAYLSTRVEDISWDNNSIELRLVFPKALGDIIVEHFIVLNGEGELVSDGTAMKEFPLSLRKGDEFRITQTINLRGEDDKV